MFLVESLRHHPARKTGDLVDFLVKRDAHLQILELDRSAGLGEDGEGVGIPFDDDVVDLDGLAVRELDFRAVDYPVALANCPVGWSPSAGCGI
jgi:hypothetical protein